MNKNIDDNKTEISNDFLARVLRHDAFRKGIAAAAAGALFAVAAEAIFGSSDS